MDVKNKGKSYYNPYYPGVNEVLTTRELVGRLSEAASYDARFRAKQKNDAKLRSVKTPAQIAVKMQKLSKRNELALDHMAAYARKHNIQPDKTFMERLTSLITRPNKKNKVYTC